MADRRHSEHRTPIQTSAVIVLGAHKAPAIPPPSPPTPCVSPHENSLCEPTSAFSLVDRRQSSSPPREPDDVEAVVGSGSGAGTDADAATEAETGTGTERRLSCGIHVLKTEAAALASLATLYEADLAARRAFDRAVQVVARQGGARGGKLVVVGVGKSGHIGKKLVATLQSLAVRSVFLHPTEALHGDLGVVGPDDTLLFITHSGKTPELLLLLPHLDEALPVIVLTSHTRPDACELTRRRPDAVLLPAPIPEPEKASFGVSAPTTSTTATLALCDALAMAVAAELHQNVPAEFARNHPGGAIGAAADEAMRPRTIKHLAVPWDELAEASDRGLSRASLGAHLLRAGYDSPSGWLRIEDGVASPTRIRSMSMAHVGLRLDQIPGLVATRRDMISMPSDTSIRRAADIVRTMQQQDACGSDSVIAVMDVDTIVGVVEVGQILDCQASP
ncbi:hypothetical protein CDD83_454 [Cordyceps sp. RAO-2017]|nr:hypothetical protein CDD83_454 [Cordyceps sp. RAO-2017]